MSWAQWHTLAIPALERLRQEDHVHKTTLATKLDVPKDKIEIESIYPSTALRRWRQVDLCEFQAGHSYIVRQHLKK